MRALQFTAYGGPKVLEWGDAPDPHAGPGQIRIAVRAASVNPIDWKTFAGALSGGRPMVGTGYLVARATVAVAGDHQGEELSASGADTSGRGGSSRVVS